MTSLENLTLLSPLDIGALALLVTLWIAIGWRIEHPSPDKPSTSWIMADYRKQWMQQMIAREVRIFDAQTIGTLRQGTSFFASTCVIAIGGTLALIGNAEQVAGVAADLTDARSPAIVWEMKLLVIVVFLTNAFLKFVWSNRLFGYCSVIMGAAPNDPVDPKAASFARKAAALNIAAARTFNRGLRAIYFGLATVAWLAGPVPLIVATIVTCVVIWRREFASQSRKALLEEDV
ncbi:DUF599 domain-containing protein [uncultured Sulfitobacter sp.]|uniref:DUF599 domain-containing protein n=1 Tax=uncultured Sulfitobacter sp. TaxID=191468 RepID=UPI002601C62A|nr:DUF599 domain-containing protein [uncultured Sulfitobacter sp.]